LNLPGKGALEALAALAAEGLHVRVVILAPHMSHDELARAKHAGAHGIAYCDMPASTLVRCVRVVHAGGEFLQGREQERQLAKVSGQFRLQRAFAPSLTARENSVAEHVKIGLSNKEIARALGLTEGTVKSHLHRVYDKLHVHGRYALMKSGWEDATPGTEQVARSP
jgi:DNA-binding NarL/FixJ family response regulator